MKKSFVGVILISFFILFGAAGAAFSQAKSSPAKRNVRQSNQKNSVWSGDWNYPSRFYSKSLEIKVLTAKKFKFKLNSMNGANTGEIDGTAQIKGNRAYFDDKKTPPTDSQSSGCKLIFVNRGKSIDIKATADCGNYGGAGVGFEGKLSKGNPPFVEQNFVQLDVFPNRALDRRFKTLVGRDYENFLDSFHQIYDETDLDNFGAKAFSACVRGICPWMAGIIMYDKRGRIWAAVVHNVDDSDETNVNYYTNDAAWTGKLPKTIEIWANDKKESNKNLTVVYKSRK